MIERKPGQLWRAAFDKLYGDPFEGYETDVYLITKVEHIRGRTLIEVLIGNKNITWFEYQFQHDELLSESGSVVSDN